MTREAAPRLGIKLHVTDVKAADRLQTWGESDLGTALSAAANEHPDALFVYPDPILIAQGKQVADFAVANRLPTMFAFRESVDAGGLMSYGASLNAMGASAAELIAKILDGKRPSELPVEQATRFELVINLKTARALGLIVPFAFELEGLRRLEPRAVAIVYSVDPAIAALVGLIALGEGLSPTEVLGIVAVVAASAGVAAEGG